MRKAVIGIGSNSIRLLVAEVTDGRIACVHRGRAETRPFEGLVNGCFTPESMETITRTVEGFVIDALSLHAAALSLFATSATRDAKNQPELAARLLERTGLSLRILTGEEEAAASYAGGALPGECGLLDIGGGSTEIVVGRDGIPHQRISLQLGSVRLYQTHPLTATADIAPVLEPTIAWIRQTWGENPRPAQWAGVGGTCTTLASMDAGAPESAEGHRLSRAAVRDLLYTLAPLPLEARRKHPGLPPKRADVIVPGALIVLACMEALSIDGLFVTRRGNLDGFLLHPPDGV